MEEILRQQIEKIVPLTDDEFRLVLSHFSVGNYKKHQYIVQQENPVPYVHFVVKVEKPVKLTTLFQFKLTTSFGAN